MKTLRHLLSMAMVIGVIIIAIPILPGPAAASPPYPPEQFVVPLVSDDFNDNWLDTAKWTTLLSPGWSSSVTEHNQRLEIQQRGHLITRDEYDPAARPLLITGLWTFAGAYSDNMDIYTRCDAVIGGVGGPWGAMRKGVQVHYEPWNDQDFRVRYFDDQTTHEYAVSDYITFYKGLSGVGVGSTVAFSIIDDGQYVKFRVEHAGGPGSGFSEAEINVNYISGSNFIVFMNREQSGDTAYLDNVEISTVPEPGALSVLGLGLASLAAAWRKRR